MDEASSSTQGKDSTERLLRELGEFRREAGEEAARAVIEELSRRLCLPLPKAIEEAKSWPPRWASGTTWPWP